MNTKILHQKRSDFERREAASEVRLLSLFSAPVTAQHMLCNIQV
jgi:hypothetical protein